MDEIVLKAMAKWPDVPAVYGWLALDRRGQWQLKGSRIENPAIAAFIGRNYAADEAGCWYFQNGPQRVFVDLDYTPLVLRWIEQAGLVTHNDLNVADLQGVWVDENGVLIVATEHGPALVDDRDVEALSLHIVGARGNALDEDSLIAVLERLQQGEPAELFLRYAGNAVVVQPIRADEAPKRFGFNPHPQPPAGMPECRPS